MKKVTFVTVAACLALTATSYAQSAATAARSAKPKPRVTAPKGSMNAGTTATGANAEARAGIGAATSTTGSAASSILDANVTAALAEKTNNSCNIGDGITTLDKQGKAIVQRAFTMGIAGGQGCLGKFDAETSPTAVEMYKGGIARAEAQGLKHLSDAKSTAQVAQVVDGMTDNLHSELGLEGSEEQNPEATDRFEGTCANGCDLGSTGTCNIDAINLSRSI